MKEKMKYRCHWCYFEFEQEVGRAYGKEGKNVISDHVICPNCGNGLKTWAK